MGALALSAACAQEILPAPRLGARPAAPRASEAASAPESPPQYVVGDPVRPSVWTVLDVGGDRGDGGVPDDKADKATGVVLEGVRFVLRGSQVRTSTDMADALQSAWRVPSRLGGGFLFRARSSLYAGASFEGLLRPVAAFPAEVEDVSFAPKGALVRAESGERWMIDPASGKRVPIAPPGLLQVAALDDGRAAALVEGGQLLVTTDAGAHWTDATARLRAAPKRVFLSRAETTHEESLWLETQSGGAFGLLPGGRLAAYDALPASEPPPALRAKVPAWRMEEAPLRHAMRVGAPSRDGSALVIAGGDLVQVDVVSGAVEVVAAGKLPPDATCVATRTQDDVVFTCGRISGASFVVAHAFDRAPVIEQTFPDNAGAFVVSDDGGILWLGSCDKRVPAQRRVVCVRMPGGGWQPIDLDAAGDAGTGPTFNVVRWIPRGDGGAIAVVGDIGGTNAWGLLDSRTGEVHAWPVDALTPVVRSALQANEGARVSPIDTARLADRTWTVTPQGTLRGWAALGSGIGAVEIGVDGSIQTSPFTFERTSSAGALALARTREGRIWQTLDRGFTWSEVAAPLPLDPPAGSTRTPARWSGAIWDSGTGWDGPRPLPSRSRPSSRPRSAPHRCVADPGPGVPRDGPPEERRRGDGRAQPGRPGPRRVAPGRGRSEEADRLPAPGVSASHRRSGARHPRRRLGGAARHRAWPRHPARRRPPRRDRVQQGRDGAGARGGVRARVRSAGNAAPRHPRHARHRRGCARPRRAASGLAARGSGPERRRPGHPVGRVGAGRSPGAARRQRRVRATRQPSAAARPRVAYELGRSDEWRIVSAVALDGNAVAWLEEDSSGQARVLRLGTAAAPSLAFELDAPPSAQLYPANVDALAVGPRGELAVVRTPSGGEPPSAGDPAVLLVPGAPAATLAPWSTLTSADDAACKADTTGWRVTVQTIAPWLRLASGADLRGATDSFMLARLRWSPTRACLEGVELRTDDTAIVSGATDPSMAWAGSAESWVVAQFAGGAAAGRVVVLPGGELREPLECRLGPP